MTKARCAQVDLAQPVKKEQASLNEGMAKFALHKLARRVGARLQ